MLNSSLQQPSHEIMGGGSVDSTMVSGLRQTSLAVAGNASPPYMLPDLAHAHHQSSHHRQGSRNVYLQKGHGGAAGLNAHLPGGAGIGTQGPPGGLQGVQGSGLRARAPFLLHTDRAKVGAQSTQPANMETTHKVSSDVNASPLSITGKKPAALEGKH